MIQRAISDYPINLTGSFVAGDNSVDMGLARGAGIPGLLVLTGYGLRERELLAPGLTPDVIADDLLAAVRWFGRKMGMTGQEEIDEPDPPGV
jgi:histidinol phosphatase-like enzyme